MNSYSYVTVPSLDSPAVFTSALVKPAWSGRGGSTPAPTKTAGDYHHRRRDRAILPGSAFFDGPDFRTVMGGYKWQLDLDKLVDFAGFRMRLASEFGVRQFTYLDDVTRPRLHRRVRSAGWDVLVVSHAQSGRSSKPCTDWVCHQLARRNWPIPTTVVLTGHNADYAGAVGALLNLRFGRLILAGLVGFYSRDLYECSDHPDARLLDLQFDLHVARIRGWWRRLQTI